MRSEPCPGFAWIGQSLLCCDDCGWPWFLHEAEATYTVLFGRGPVNVPWSAKDQERIPALIAAWNANNLWQRESSQSVRDGKWVNGPDVERRVGKDFPYPTGPTRPVREGVERKVR